MLAQTARACGVVQEQAVLGKVFTYMALTYAHMTSVFGATRLQHSRVTATTSHPE